MLHFARRLALATSVLFTGTAAVAQASPEIAYAKGGRQAEVYLINSDSTGRRLLYRGARGTEIFHVDIRPGGGQLAIEEHVRNKDGSETGLTSTIKIIDYDVFGSVIGAVRSLTLTCLSGSVDYHPSDGSLLYRNCLSPNRIDRLNTTTMVPADLGLPHDAFVATWLDADNVLYYVNADPDSTANNKYWKVSMAALGSPAVVDSGAAGSLDPSTSADKVLVSGFSEIRMLDVTAGTNVHLLPGEKGHFSPNSQNIIYITNGPGADYILIRPANLSGSSTNLTGKGNYTALDWRN